MEYSDNHFIRRENKGMKKEFEFIITIICGIVAGILISQIINLPHPKIIKL